MFGKKEIIIDDEQIGELLLERDKLQAVIDNVNVGIGITDPNGTTLSLNAEGLRIHGFASETEMFARLDSYIEEFGLRYKDGRLMPFEEWPISKAMRGEFVSNYEVILVRHGTREPRFISYSVVPIYDKHDQVMLIVFNMVDLTERKKAEEELQRLSIELERRMEERTKKLAESEERFRNLVETSSDWIWEVDENGVYTYASPQVQDILGYEVEEVLGKTPFDFMPPYEAERVAVIFGPVIAGHMPFSGLENTNRHKNGRLVVLETNGVPFFDASGVFKGYRGIDRDITERKHSEESLRKSNDLLERVFSSIHVLIAYLDRSFNFIRVNQAYAAADGRDQSFFIGKNHFELYPNEDNMAIFKKVVETGEPYTVQAKSFVYPEHPEWGVSYWDWSLYPIKGNDGNVKELIFSLLDVTKSKKAEEELNQNLIMLDFAYKELQVANAELKKANEKAMEADRLKSEFMANMSHELRTPLNSVIALSSILLARMDGELTDEQEKQVRIIEKSGRHLLDLINDILDLSKIVAGKMEINKEVFHIEEVVEDVRTTINPLAIKKGHDVTFITDVDIPDIRSDKNKLRQILLNLLSNAVKFTPQGGSIIIHASNKGGNVDIRVKDNGIGIARKDLDKIFDEFRQVDGSYTREFGGTGLGLAITKRLVRLLGGEIGVESEPGKGSTFSVVIPELL